MTLGEWIPKVGEKVAKSGKTKQQALSGNFSSERACFLFMHSLVKVFVLGDVREHLLHDGYHSFRWASVRYSK